MQTVNLQNANTIKRQIQAQIDERTMVVSAWSILRGKLATFNHKMITKSIEKHCAFDAQSKYRLVYQTVNDLIILRVFHDVQGNSRELFKVTLWDRDNRRFPLEKTYSFENVIAANQWLENSQFKLSALCDDLLIADHQVEEFNKAAQAFNAALDGVKGNIVDYFTN